jgi:hypothetical protein
MQSPKRRVISVIALLAAVATLAATRHGSQAAPVVSRPPAPTHSPRMVASYARLPLSFEANQGQTDPRAKFISRGRGYTLFLTGDEAVLSLRSQKSGVRSQESGSRSSKLEIGNWRLPSRNSMGNSLLPPPDSILPLSEPRVASHESQVPSSSVLRMKLAGANPAVQVTGLDGLPGKSNYFIGNDPKKWRTNVPTYAKVRYEGVYPGIDLVYYGNQRQLEYDFIVAPGADPDAIQLALETGNSKIKTGNSESAGPKSGTTNFESVRIDTNGDLVIPTGEGEVRFHKPVVYQELSAVGSQQSAAGDDHQSPIINRQSVEGRFVLVAENRVGFEVGAYDKTRPLVIDPVLSYSSYLGGSNGESVLGVAADASGNAYVTGYTPSADDFPLVNALFGFGGYSADAFVAKISPDGTLLFSTFLGGNDGEVGRAIAVDGSGYIYVVGFTTSTDFPTPFGFQTTHSGAIDALHADDVFIAQLSNDGMSLIYGSYLGGTNNDEASAVAVDGSGHAYVTGHTGSGAFPTTSGAFMETGGGIIDAFVAKFDTSQSGADSLIYSTHLGGSNQEQGRGIAVDASGNAYVTGYTFSTDFPTLDPLYGSLGDSVLWDSFVSKLNADGSALLFSTYLGGNRATTFGIALDSSRNIYVTGFAESSFPTVNALDSTRSSNEAFVAKIKADGSGYVFSTYLGGSSSDEARGIAVDGFGNAYIAGLTGSSSSDTSSNNFPVKNAVQPASAGYFDAFVTKIKADGSALIYSTFLGGSSFDLGYGVAVDGSGNAYVVGTTHSNSDFPLVNAFQDTYGGGFSGSVYSGTTGFNITGEGFVAKISLVPDFDFSSVSAITADVGGSGSSTVTVNSLDAFNSAVALSVGSPPSGFAPSFDPSSVTPAADGSASSTLTVDLGLSVTPGMYNMNVTGTSGSLSHSTPVEVTVNASASGTAEVIDGMTAIGCIDNSGVSGALLAKLAQAQAFIDAGKTQAAINTLNALLNQLQAQRGKHIATTCTQNGTTFDPTEVLIAQVQALLQSLGASALKANPVVGYVVNSKGAPLAGITVSILNSSNSPTAGATTDITGFFFFADTGLLIAGSNYTAKVTPVPKPYKGSTPASQVLPWSGAAITLSTFLLK